MSQTLKLELITPDGHHLEEEGVEVVVLRRREPRFELGSEIAIFPGHAPLLVRTPDAPVRYRKGDQTVELRAARGFAEVRRGRVLIFTSRFQ